MFCPRCGNPEQTEKTFCRRCGNYIPNLSAPSVTAPEVHVKANLALGALTVLTSFTVALLLYLFFLGRGDTPPVIYVMFGLLIAMGACHVQTVWRSWLLHKHLRAQKVGKQQFEAVEMFRPADTYKRLNSSDLKDAVPASITDRATRKFTSYSERNKR